MTLSSPLRAALAYAAEGYPVFPCGPEKRPKVRWKDEATTSEKVIRQWWGNWPEAMIGLPTGNGLAVIDLDLDKHTGARVGDATVERLGLDRALAGGLVARTPSGGRHIYFAGDVPTSAGRIGDGVDTRGAGGYVIAPGSVNGFGAYAWEGPGILEQAPPPLPAAIADALGHATEVPREPKINGGLLTEPAGPDEVREILSWIDPDAGGYEVWCTILMALHHHFGGSDAGLELAESWSAAGARYRPGEVAEKWRSFRTGAGRTFASVCLIASRNGADLADIARRHRGRVPVAKSVTPLQLASPSALPEHSEEALALSFAARHADDLRYVAAWGRWLRWSSVKWEFDDSLHAFDLARRICRDCASLPENRGRAPGLASAKTVAAVERLAKADRRLSATVDQWDSDPWALNTPAGVVDLKSGHLRPHRSSEYQTRVAAVAPSGGCPTWRRFLDDVTGGDEALQNFLQRLAGYILTGSTREHALTFLHGSGGNGKSVFSGMWIGVEY